MSMNGYKSKLYARDVLNGKELGILFEHLKGDEIDYIIHKPDEYAVYGDDTVVAMATDRANSIINNETLDSLWEYDLWHVLSYKDEYKYIVDKIKKAIEDERKTTGVIYSYESLSDFGYTYDGMIGFDKKVAVHLFYNTDIPIFGLREDNSESSIEYIDDMEDFEVFGLEDDNTNMHLLIKTLLSQLSRDKITIE